MARLTEDEYRRKARHVRAFDAIDIDDDADLDRMPDGAWVPAWIWVADPQDEEEDAC